MDELIKMNVTDVALKELQEKYAKVPDVTTKEGYEFARLGLAEMRSLRTGLKDCKSEKKTKALIFTRGVDKEFNRCYDIIVAVEAPYKEAKVAEDAKKEAGKEEKRQAEEDRVFRITERINALREVPFDYSDKGSEEIKKQIEDIDTVEINEETFNEFAEEAESVKKDVMHKLAQLLDKAVTLEEEEDRLAKERKEFEEKQAEATKERDRIAKIKDKIDLIKNLPFEYDNDDSSTISLGITSLEAMEITEDEFEEFISEATLTQEAALSKLNNLRDHAKQREELKVRQDKIDEDERLETERLENEAEEKRLVEEKEEGEKKAEADAEEDIKAQKVKEVATLKALRGAADLDLKTAKKVLEAIKSGTIPDVTYQ